MALTDCTIRISKCKHLYSATGICFVIGILVLYTQPIQFINISILGSYRKAPDLNWLRKNLNKPTEGSNNQHDVVRVPEYGSSDDDSGEGCLQALDWYQKKRKIIQKWSFCKEEFDLLRKCMKSPETGVRPLPNFYLRDANTTIVDPLYAEASVGFVHLPKSGGTSVEEFLSPIVGTWGIFFGTQMGVAHCNEFTYAVQSVQNSKSRWLFYSKRVYGLHEFAPKHRPFMYITWLRKPVDRVVSAYHYIKKTKPNYHHMYEKYIVQSKNLTECLQKMGGNHVPGLDNYFVRLLQFGDHPDVDGTYEDCCGAILASDPTAAPAIGEEHYLVARENLRKNMAFVGIMEEFKLSQDMLGYILGKPQLTSVVEVNTNPHKTVLTDFERREIERMNYWDMKLYDDAKEIFERQKERYRKITKHVV